MTLQFMTLYNLWIFDIFDGINYATSHMHLNNMHIQVICAFVRYIKIRLFTILKNINHIDLPLEECGH